MFKISFSVFFLLATITQASSLNLKWDNPEAGTGLHVWAQGKDKHQDTWIVREAKVDDVAFYQNILGNKAVLELFGNGQTNTPEEAAEFLNWWVEQFSQGVPTSRLTIVQNDQPIGFGQLCSVKAKPGEGSVLGAFELASQNKGIGVAGLKFMVEEYAPLVQALGLGEGINRNEAVVTKFKCFAGDVLRTLYATARPKNEASKRCLQYLKFEPYPTADQEPVFSCEDWEESQVGNLEDYIMKKYYATDSDGLKSEVLYSMIDDKGERRTISYITHYNSLRYHFSRAVTFK